MKKKIIAATIVVASLALIATVTAAFRACSGDRVQVAEAKEPTADQKAFQIDLNGLELDAYLAGLGLSADAVEFRDASLRQHNEARTISAKAVGLTRWCISDAVEFVFDGSQALLEDPENPEKLTAVADELRATILSNPVVADMMAQGIVDLKLGDKTLGELNPWIVEFIEENDKFYAEDPDSPPAGLEHWLSCKAEGQPVYVTREFLRRAVGLCMIIDQMDQHAGYLQSEVNYHLTGMQLPNMTRAELSGYTESQAALILDYVGKDGNRLFRFGFNLLDRRFELFDVTSEIVTPNPTPTTPTPNPTPTTPTPDKKPVKDPTKDPVVNGNAEQGGGKNDDPGPGEFQPTEPARPTSYDVQESQYQPPSQELRNTPEQDKKEIEEQVGPVIKQDNATPPPTDPIPVQPIPEKFSGTRDGEIALPD